MLDKLERQDIMGHEQIAPREARSNSLHALRGIVHAVNQPPGGRVDQHRYKATC